MLNYFLITLLAAVDFLATTACTIKLLLGARTTSTLLIRCQREK